MDQKLIDKYVKRAHDAGVYEMLLKRWLEVYNTIEDLNGLIKSDCEDLYIETKKQLNYQAPSFKIGDRVTVGELGIAVIESYDTDKYYLVCFEHSQQKELIHEFDLEEIK